MKISFLNNTNKPFITDEIASNLAAVLYRHNPKLETVTEGRYLLKARRGQRSNGGRIPAAA